MADPVDVDAGTSSEGISFAVPEESELTLLCLDYLRDLRRSYQPQTLKSAEGLNADYLTVACWALSRVFVAPDHLTVAHGNDPFMEPPSGSSRGLDSTGGKVILPSLRAMEDELILKDSATEEADQKKEEEDVYNMYEYDDSHASNSHRFYQLSGLAGGPSLRGPLTMGEIVAAGLVGLGARSRLDAEREMIQSPLFQQFVHAVKERGFFNDPDNEGQDKEKVYESRFRKVVAKFRTKLANKADTEESGELVAVSAAECVRKQRKLKMLQATNGCLEQVDSKSDMFADSDIPTPSSYLNRKHVVQACVASIVKEEHTDKDSASAPSFENPIDMDEAEKLKNQGNSHMQRKEYALAAEAYTKALKLSPTGPHSHVYFSNRAAALVSMKKFQEAISDSERSLALKPDYGKAHARLGLTYFLIGNYRQAMEAYTVALKYEPDNKSSKAYLEKAAKRLAESGEEPGTVTQASFSIVSEWEKTAKGAKTENDDPQQLNDEREAEKYKAKGNSYMTSRDYEAAVVAYTKAIDLSSNGPQSHVYYSNRAAALCYLERYEDAEVDSLKSLSLNPSYGKAHARLGLSRFFMQDYAGAVDAYTAALQNDPDNAASMSYLEKAKAKLALTQTEAIARRLSDDPQMREMAAKVMSKPESNLIDDPDMQNLAKKAMNDPSFQAMFLGQQK